MIEFAELGPGCGFVVVDHARQIANYTTRAQLQKWGVSAREQWEKVARVLLWEERACIEADAGRTSYTDATSWLGYAASRGIATERRP